MSDGGILGCENKFMKYEHTYTLFFKWITFHCE